MGKLTFTEEEQRARGFSCWLKYGSEHYARIGSKRGPDGKCRRPAARENLSVGRARLAELMKRGRELEVGE